MDMRNIYSLLFILVVGLTVRSEAQIIIKNGSVSTCSGVFYDSGGSGSDYRPNESYVFTICSNDPTRNHISLGFDQLDIATGDELCFFDGNSVNAPLLACASDLSANQNAIVQTTATNPSGCMTVRFRSNSSIQAKGWAANIICIPSCQTIKAVVDATDPAIVPADTGWINTCPITKRVNFKAHGLYPQNGYAYGQSDTINKFEWNFNDGSQVAYGTDVSHVFENSGGFIVRLTITDTMGCQNINFIKQRVRVSPRPTFKLGNIPSQVCAGTEIKLKGKTGVLDTSFQVSTTQNQASFQVGGVRSGRLFIPDDPTKEYKTSIFFSDFGPGQTLTNINDLVSIFVQMEHSWARDLDIKIVCPNRQTVVLHKYDVGTRNVNELYIGIPNNSDALFSGQVNDSTFNPPGTGLRYDWTPTGGKTWRSFNSPNPYSLPPGKYKSDASLNGLIGCPLNGEWSLVVKDQFQYDNGWIFAWGIDFAKSIYPSIESFSPQVVEHGWVKNDYITTSYSMDSMVIRPKNAGTAALTYRLKDNYDCVFDTTLYVNILPPTSPLCFTCNLDTLFNTLNDATLCSNSAGVVLDKRPIGSIQSSITFDAFPNQELDATTAPLIAPYVSTLNINNIYPNTITDPLSQIDSVCIDLGTIVPSDMVFELRAPTGQTVPLFNQRGGIGYSLNSLCFSPKATRDIDVATPPYSGLYQPEGGVSSWNSLIGATLNGNWDLLVSDARGPNKDTLKRWSISFKSQNGLKYSWTPATGLSCSDCPNPTAKPTVSTTYSVTVRDSFNCTHTDNAIVTILDSLPAPISSVSNVNFTFIIFGWEEVTGATGYEVSINGGSWMSPNGTFSHSVTNLRIGDVVNFRVRAISNIGCGARIASLTQSTLACVASIGNGSNRRLEIDSILCNGQASPKVNFRYANGVAPITFIIDSLTQQSQPFFTEKIRAGNHRAIVIDSTGCSDTLDFIVYHPAPVTMSLQATPILCSGEETGTITAVAGGGVSNFIYRLTSNIVGDWRNTPLFDSLDAGIYTIEVQDKNGCSVSRDTDIVAPLPLFVDLVKQDINCFGAKNGLARAQTSGGIQPYTWQWNQGATTEQLDSLSAGSFDVTVTDKNGCSFTGGVTIDENAEIVTTAKIDSARCYNEETGRVIVNTVGGISPYVFQWNNGVIGQNNENIPAGNYKVTITDALGCIDTLSAMVLQPDSLRFDSLVSVNTRCSNEATGSATAFTSGGVIPYEYLWTPTNKTTQTINDIPAGRYVVTVKDANGCLHDSEVTVKSNTPINVDDFTVVAPLKCNGDANGQIAANVSGGAGNYSYKWSTTPVQTTSTARNLRAGTFTLTITDANNCTIVKNTNLSEPTKLNATITQFTNVKCKDESNGTATPSVLGGTPFPLGVRYNYLWNDSLAQTTPVASDLKAGFYMLTAKDANGCTDTANVNISEPAMAVKAVASQSKLGCFGQNTGEAGVIASGGVGNFTYLWSNLQRTQSIVNLGRQQYYITVTDGNSCQAIDSLNIITHDSIKISLSAIPPRCYNLKNGALSVDSISGGASNGNLKSLTYRWNTVPVQTTAQAVNIDGNRLYSVTIVDNQGCQNKNSIYVQEPDPILISSLKKEVSCFNGRDGEAEIQPLGQKAPYSFLWAENAGTQSTARAVNLAAGKYSVTVTDSAKCSIDTSITISQPARLILQKQQITPSKCVGDAVGKISVTIVGGVPVYNYLWSNGATQPNIENLKSGSYDLLVTDAHGCQLQESFSVLTPNPLDGEIAYSNVKCFGEANGTVTVDAFGGTQPYAFSIDGKNYNGVNQIIGLKSGQYDVFIKDANNCTWFDRVNITQPSRFSIEAIPDITINLGDSVQLYANVSNNQGKVNIYWKAPYDSTLSCIKCETPTSKPMFTVTYAVSAIDSAGCRAQDSVKVLVVKPRYIYVPTGFSPNNDQVNDLLTVRGKEGTTIHTYRVYDRWGELLYEAKNFKINDENHAWDGKFRGQYMNSGIYVWYIEAEYIDGAKETLKGNTTLFR